MRGRLEASLQAGVIAIILNTAALRLADVFALPTAHGGLLRLISPLVAGPLKVLGATYFWHRANGPSPHSLKFQTGFHLVVGVGMGIAYAFAVEPLLGGPAIMKGLIYAGTVWLLNAAIIFPMTGEGFAGSEHLAVAGMVWFATAHTLFFVVLALLYRRLRLPRKEA